MATEQADVDVSVQASNVTGAAAGSTAVKGVVQWTAVKVLASCGLFILAGLAGQQAGANWVWGISRQIIEIDMLPYRTTDQRSLVPCAARNL